MNNLNEAFLQQQKKDQATPLEVFGGGKGNNASKDTRSTVSKILRHFAISIVLTLIFCSIFILCYKDCIFGTNELKYNDKTCIALCEPVCITMEKENICFKNC